MVEPDGGGANALPRVARARPAYAGRSLAAVKNVQASVLEGLPGVATQASVASKLSPMV